MWRRPEKAETSERSGCKKRYGKKDGTHRNGDWGSLEKNELSIKGLMRRGGRRLRREIRVKKNRLRGGTI